MDITEKVESVEEILKKESSAFVIKDEAGYYIGIDGNKTIRPKQIRGFHNKFRADYKILYMDGKFEVVKVTSLMDLAIDIKH